MSDVEEHRPVWERLSPELRSQLLRDPARTLDPDQVLELRQAGARVGHAVWLDARPGRPKRWLASWSMRSFLEEQRPPTDAPASS